MRFEQVLCTTYQNPLLSKGKAVNHVPSQSVTNIRMNRYEITKKSGSP